MSALGCSPTELRTGARIVQEVAEVLDGARGRCRAAGGGEHWEGLAALEQQARCTALSSALSRVVEPLQLAARAVDRLAQESEQAQRVVGRLVDQGDQALRERAALLAVPVDPADVVGALVRAARLEELESLLERVAGHRRRAEDALQEEQRRLQHHLDQAWPEELVRDLETLCEVLAAASKAYSGTRLAATGAQLLRLSVRHARAADVRLRLELAAGMHRLTTFIERAPAWSRALGPLWMLAVPLTVVPPAWRDVRTGGGYDGWRGTVTRVSAGLAIPGSVAIAVPIPVPHLKAAGAITVGGYFAWRGANHVYDNRELVQRLGGWAWQRARTRVDELEDLLSPAIRMPWGPLGPLGPLLGSEQGRDWVGDRLGELTRWTEGRLEDLADGVVQLPAHWDRVVRQLGEPLRLDDLPIPSGPRLPAVPTLPFIPNLPGDIFAPWIPDWPR